ncbi:WD40 repeat-like protein [Gonapodya prolifera JEL478]|uniref:WD40 repeat-like protein n=1 Tax=Gonapodya prolifera (strain JEL478) TaxID=1344416 RepID=A0A139ASN7_GONPJ|nr:WD40 repeat-like protein [Gonapodya prolifera JEL478]|eukprot:KXS19719.1 WD40 repeat-like protein [Gonapodya prolifera JEL478]
MTIDKPQIIVHLSRSLNYTPYDVRWVPSSAKFVVLGQHPRGTGALQVCELEAGAIKVLHESEKQHAFKCGTFGASSLSSRHLATGDFSGRLALWDLERLDLPVYAVKAHDQLINCLDGCGGVGVNSGPPELATGSRDGSVKIWDTRQRDKPVARIAPEKAESARDAWCVAFGNSYSDEERVIATGYDNGDVKMFDLRAMALLWETNLKNGVCSLEFDRKDIRMNKLTATTLDAQVHTFDVRTLSPNKEFASVMKKDNTENTTVWTVRHSPQNRDLFITSGGNGNLNLYRYMYPEKRSLRDQKTGTETGVAGTVELLQSAHVAEQPVSSLDWHPDRQGLAVFSAFDQTVKVGIVTRLAQY